MSLTSLLNWKPRGRGVLLRSVPDSVKYFKIKTIFSKFRLSLRVNTITDLKTKAFTLHRIDFLFE